MIELHQHFTKLHKFKIEKLQKDLEEVEQNLFNYEIEELQPDKKFYILKLAEIEIQQNLDFENYHFERNIETLNNFIGYK